MAINISRKKLEDQDLKGFFIADMHVHSNHSFDSNSKIEKILAKAEELDIYIALTDHNRIGGVKEAYETKIGKKRVIPGIEITCKENKDIIAYFYDFKELEKFFDNKVKPKLKNKNSLRNVKINYPLKQLLIDLKKENCLIMLPHPFAPLPRKSHKLIIKQELLDYLDLVEVINEQVSYKSNLAALGWAMINNKSICAGSDAHEVKRIGKAVVATKAKTKKVFLNKLKKGEIKIIGQEISLPKKILVFIKIFARKTRIIKNKKETKKELRS